MADENGNGTRLTKEQWHQVIVRAGWLRFALTILATTISFAAVGGIYVTKVDNRIENNWQHLERVDVTLQKHGEAIAGVRASQSATETAAARLEERLTAQGRTLRRIESLLETLLNENYQRQTPLPRRLPNMKE